MSVNNKVPEIRFEGFSGEWNYLTLGGNAKFTKGQGYSKGDLVTSGAPIILYGRLYTKYQTVITSVDTFVTEKDKSVKSMGGEVIVPASGESPEDISRASVVSEPNVILGGDLNIVLPSKKIHSTFLALAISNGRLKNELSSKAQGKSVVHIRNSDLADLGLILPTEYIEQTAIGNYFKKLDSLIDQHQNKHDKLSSIKKAMLEKMFPKQGETMPEIRFKRFSGEWKEKTLSEAAPLRGGFAFQSSEFCDSGIPIVKISNILSTGEVGGEFSYYKEISNDENYLLLDGSALLAMSGATTGKVSILKCHDDTKFYQNQRVGYFQRNVDFDYLFISTLVRSHIFRDKLDAVLVAGAQPNVSSKEIDSFEFMMPYDIKEQLAIGNYFQNLDTLINQHQQQITKLNNIKQACLSKMFV